ncbi:MAG: daunorubicin ABC transporter ATP-binding protein [Ilumatobacter coccineus]|uniref:Daunorubicin ABC transporter ATP-binding protein n=1 Tax=Ilumatobacter coccineus TaxID=467094 RepID=A0A2G6KG21_9ACTN|nr:MAG: daunorubicin ABC transporter ATP-binding protein [Ilumatobacter coccineus]
MDRPPTSQIRCRQLVRHFDEVEAVSGIDLDVARGEIYGLLGPNGAGKSTTVRMLCTLLAPTSGSGSVAGHDIVTEPAAVRLRIGVALQEAALDPRQTGVEQLRLQGRLYGLTKTEINQRVDELADLIDIGDALGRMVNTYSGGMQRRLDLAVALIHNPEVLFLDEPTTGLDPASRASVWAEVERLNRELGMTILLTTQYLEEADALADRVGIVDEGHLIIEGTPDQLKRTVGRDVIVVDVGERTDVDRVVAAVGGLSGVHGVEVHGTEVLIAADEGSSRIGPVAVALDQADLQPASLSLRTPTLDDVFLEVTGSRLAPSDSNKAVAA